MQIPKKTDYSMGRLEGNGAVRWVVGPFEIFVSGHGFTQGC